MIAFKFPKKFVIEKKISDQFFLHIWGVSKFFFINVFKNFQYLKD